MRSFWYKIAFLLLAGLLSGLASGRAIDRTIAKINDDILTESDLAEVIAEVRGEHHAQRINAFDEATSETVGSMLDRALLLQEARRLQIRPSEEELHRQVEGMVREIRDGFPSQSDFHRALAAEGLSVNQLKEKLVKQTRDDFMVYHVVDSRFSVSRADMQNYESDKDGGEGVQLRLRRLGIEITKKTSAEAACRKARETVARTIMDGISFEEGVRRYSEVPGAAQDGGYMGYMELDKLSADVRAAVESLTTGQASAPVVAGGYANVFYVEGRRGAKVAVREQKFVEARADLLKSLRRRAILQVYDDRLVPLLPQDYLGVVTGRRQADGAGSERPGAVGAEQITAPPRGTPASQQVLYAPGQRGSQDQSGGRTQDHQAQPTPVPQGYAQQSYSTPPQQGYQQQRNNVPQQQSNQQPRRGWFGRF